jgi:hypothetical protein
MKAQEAVAQVNATKFKPGWRPVARERGGYTVEIGFDIETVNTSDRDASGEFNRPYRISPTRTVSVEHFTETMLDYVLLKLAGELDEHENREFLARRSASGKWEATLHPHTYDGELSWLILTEADQAGVLV